MLPRPESACFVIADISGYTNFLAAVELDHAQDIIADFMDTVVKGLRPPFRLAKFEGDAAFCYSVTDKIDGSLLQDAIESAYFAFRRRMRNIRQASACQCEACRTMGALDFKFVVHHGEMVKQRMGGREELAGRDVILVHRLLKNTVSEKVGNRAYVLYSDACIRVMNIDPVVQGLTEHHETIDIIGDVRLWFRDLDEAWEMENLRNRIEVTRETAAAVFEFDIAAPRPLVWEHATAPAHRPRWQGADEVRETSETGRRGVGTKNHCMHGADAILEEFIDWRPFDYVTFTTLMPQPAAPKILQTFAFEDRDGGTHIEVRVGKVKTRDQAFLESELVGFGDYLNGAMTQLRLLVEGHSGSQAVIEEPPLLPSRERFLSEPVHARRLHHHVVESRSRR